MADVKTDSTLTDATTYLAQQAADIARKHASKPKKRLDQPGEIGTFETKPYTIVKDDAGFEMKGVGNPDAVLIGPRPKRPDRIIQEDKKTF